MDKAIGRWLGGRLFLSPGKGKQGPDKAAGTLGMVQRRVREWQRGKVIGTSVSKKVGNTASLLAKMMEPEQNRLRDEPL